MHSSRMCTACSLTESHRKNHTRPPHSNHACLPPGATMHAPPEQPCMPPGATTHAPWKQPCRPPWSNHTCPPDQPHMPPLGATMHAPLGATTHAPLGATTHTPLGTTTHAPPSNHACPPMNRMTNRCKNITLPQTSFAGGNNRLSSIAMRNIACVAIAL